MSAGCRRRGSPSNSPRSSIAWRTRENDPLLERPALPLRSAGVGPRRLARALHLRDRPAVWGRTAAPRLPRPEARRTPVGTAAERDRHLTGCAELVQRLAATSRVVSHEQSIRIQNELFDRLASVRVRRSDAFHFVSSVGLQSARKAKRLGAVVICDERAEHSSVQRRVLAAEYDFLGIPFEPHVAIWEKRVEREYEASDHLFVGSDYSKDTYVAAGWDADRSGPSRTASSRRSSAHGRARRRTTISGSSFAVN